MALTGETIRKLGLLKLSELASIIAEQDSIAETMSMAFDERIDCIVDQLYEIKNENRIRTLSKSARFKYPQADLSSMLFLPERELDRSMFINISSCVFVQTCKNIVLYGPTGCGKSFAACMIGKAACRHLYKTKYIRFPDLMSSYKELADHSARMRFLRRFSRYEVLIIDEWLKDVPSDQDISFMFELVERREDVHPTIFCSQYSPSEWVTRMGASVKSESITDKFIYDSLLIGFNDFNMRNYLAKQNPKKWC